MPDDSNPAGRGKTPAGGKIARKSKATVFKPKNKLAEKVPGYGGKPAHLAIAEAEQRVQNLKGDYLKHLERDMADVDNLVSAYRRDSDPDTLKKLFRVIHNMRGQAATFGYPLITQVGRSLCLYMMEQEDRQFETDMRMLELHTAALKVIYREEIKGMGDAISQETVVALMRAVELKTGERLLR